MSARQAVAIDEILSRQIVIVTGKGGVGKSTVAAALARQASIAGKRVLAVDVAADGSLERMFGERQEPSFVPRAVTKNCSVVALLREDALHEYLHVYFHVPKITRHTPIGRVIEFVATSVPGAKDILILGKIVYEAQRTDRNGRRFWDCIVVDGMSTGHAIAQIEAPFEIQELVQGGIITTQVSSMTEVLTNRRRTTVVTVTLPEEMPMIEEAEIRSAVRRLSIDDGMVFVNKMFLPHVDSLPGTLDPSLSRAYGIPASDIHEAVDLANNLRILQRAALREADLPSGRTYALPLLGTSGGAPTATYLGRHLTELAVPLGDIA